jgi:catechol 2,3-dioxygenase-like lactoylglutathione lyase family enzyme
MAGFRMGSLNHVHVVVPDRAEAAAWYREHLGFEPVSEARLWADVEGGPLHLSADGGRSGIAVFEASEGHATTTLELGAAFVVDAEQFVAFARGLDAGVFRAPDGKPLTREAIVDFDLCYAYDFLDPWGNRFELDCYDTEAVKRDLVEAFGISPVRYW